MLKIKRWGTILAAAVLSALLLSACRTDDVQVENNSVDMVAESISEEISSMTKENAEDASETVAAVLSENKIADGMFLPPDEDFLRSIFSEGDEIHFTLDSSGKYAPCDRISLYADLKEQMHRENREEMLSEEYYEENKEDFEDYVSSYEEYRAMMEEYLSDENEESEPLLYFSIVTYCYTYGKGPDLYSEEQVFIRAVDRIFERINEEPEIAERITECLESGRNFYADAQAEYEGNDTMTFFSVFATAEEMLNDDMYESAFLLIEQISMDGRKGITLGGTFVPADTEKLFLTNLTMSAAEVQTKEVVPEDCLKVSTYDMDEHFDYVDNRYDLKYIAENLPELRELYIFIAEVTNTEYIGEMKNLESLSYDAYVMAEDGYYEPASDTPFKELPKLKNLWLYGSHSDYSFLNDMPAIENVFVNLRYYSQPYDTLFDCPAVTGIEIDISEIERLKDMKNLRHLHLITTGISIREGGDSIDLSVLGELKELSCLHIRCSGYSPENISSIGELSKLENLELSYISDVEDWSFMQRLTSLKRIYIYEVRNIFSVIDEMTWLDEIIY